MIEFTMSSSCFLCQEPGDLSCTECQTVACSTTHLAVHKNPTSGCAVFHIESRPGVGNVMVASKHIKAGEVILTDHPAVWGPNVKASPACVNCLATWNGSSLCPACSFPVCGDKCSSGSNHRQECPLLARLVNKPIFAKDTSNPALAAVNVVRLLRLRGRNPALADRVALLMDHVPEILQQDTLREMWDGTVIKMLMEDIPDSELTRDDILRAIGILHTNGVSLGSKFGYSLYPTFSYISHSCCCNSRYQIHPDKALVLRAQVDIQADQEITTQYITPMIGNVARRPKIKKNWFFDCTCSRCKDPTEGGTFLSGVLCRECQKIEMEGVLLPRDSLDYSSVWACSREGCDAEVTGATISQLVKTMEAEMDEYGEIDLEMIEEKISAWCRVLHHQHYLVLLLKRRLLGAMRLVDCFGGEPPRSHLARKIELAEECMAVFDVVDPGLTILRGRMMQYCNGPRLHIAKIDLKEGNITKAEFLKVAGQAMRNIKEAVKCFEDYRIDPESKDLPNNFEM